MNTIEEQLWDYIDGNLNEAQRKPIEQKIETDISVKSKYEELLNLNKVFGEMILDEPSMSFSRKVMENIAHQPAPVSLKTKVNTRIVYCIGGFFVISLLGILGYLLYHTDLKADDFQLKLNTDFNWNEYITPTTVYCFLFADLIIGLVLLDNLLRKKLLHK